MKKYLILVLVLIFGILIGLSLNKFIFSGNVVKSTGFYSWTKAICNDKECVDVLISCDNGRVVDMKPVSFKVNFSEDWNDSRDNIGEFCK